jgi:hypothetical protein
MNKYTSMFHSLRSLLMVSAFAMPLAAVAADFPAGAYVAHKSITLTFDAQGQFHVNDGKGTQVSGRYTVKGDQLELTDTEGPWACTKTGEQSGTYTWKYAGSVLTLTKVTDSCQDRVGTLAAVSWKRPQ